MRKSFAVALVVGSMLAGCGEDPPPPPPAEPRCSNNLDCDSSSVCVTRKCVLAAGREYLFIIKSAQIAERKKDGTTWDASGGLPDPFATLVIDDTVIASTSTKNDTLSPQWNEQVPAVVNATSKIVIQLTDEDLSNHDGIEAVQYRDPIQLVRQGKVTGKLCDVCSSSFDMEITPR